MSFCRFAQRCLCLLSVASAAYAQAIVEYAAKSATSALSSEQSGPALGACRMDSTLISCVNQHYPITFKVAILGLCVFGVLMLRKGR